MLRHRALTVTATALALCAIPCLAFVQPVDAGAVVSGLASTSTEFSVTSPSIDVSDLTFGASSPITIGSVTTTVMHFTMSAATMSGMTLDGVCRSSFAVETSVAAPNTATLAGSVTLDLTSLVFTLGGKTYSFTPDVPPQPGFSLPSATLSDVSMNGVNLYADTVTLHELKTKVVGC